MTDFTPGPFADYQTLERVARKALADGKANGLHDTREIAAEMRMNRQADLRKTAVIGGGYNGSGISFATARPRDPMFYWREANLPFEYTKDEEIIRLRQYARLVYLTDPVMASCIDVYSYWPLTGMHVEYKDPSIQDFYEELFMDENSGLNYQEFLPEMLHEYWLTGESFPLGHFNELLGIWEYDELINADDVKVIKSPFMREPRFELKVPEEIRKIVVEREPKWEFTKLVQAYPEFLRLAQTEEFMPVSNDLMRQVAFKCLTLGTQVMTPSGPIEARRLERGDRVVAWDEKTNTPVFSQVTYIKDNGIKPIHHVRTQQGRSVRVTGNHPFLTDQGWVDASLLVPGSRLVVGANNDLRSKYLDLDVARFLGMMMGDGSCGTKRSSQTIKFHNIDTELLNWLNEFVGRYDCHMVLDKRCSWLVTRIDGGKGPTRLNAVRSLLKEVGLFGQNTFTKRVHKVVWQGGPKAWAAFLSGYFDTDGYYNRDRGMAMWASANRPLLEDCQTLLAYLGVNSTVQEIKAPSVTTMKKNGEMCQPYRLVVSRRYTSMLASLLTPLLPRKQIVDRGWYQRKLTAQQAEDIRQRVLAGEKQNALAKEYGVGTSSVQAIIRGKSFAPVEPVLYDKVVSVTVEDPELTLAIGVEKYRNFITGGLVTHNSDKFHHRGLPIMMRAFRSLYQQEMLNAAMDSIASRLYTPLVLVRLGASAQDTGTDTAWVPTAQQLEEFQESLDIALAADFRVLTSHFATQVDLVFGREAMPDLGPDFDRLMDNKLLAFGLSRTMLMGASCLAGDTEVHLNRASKGYRTTIEKLARRYAGEPICGRPWDPEVPTFISRADGDVVRLGLVGNVWFSGVKETFELVTESGKTVRASAQHPFLTASGEWVELGELNVGDQVQVNTGRSMGEDLAFRQGYKFVFTSYHPYQVNDGWHRAQYRYKVSVHRAVMDAALNNLSYKEFIRIVREDPLRSKELVYLDPAQFHVHHLDENKKNNELSNLMVLPKVDHLRHHAEEGGKNHVLWQVGSERITSIRSFGEEPTFDIGVLDAPHNFLANDFVVHNSGETYAADALNRDVVTQMLTRAQRQAKRHFSQRAKMVAQAQGHYETEKQGGRTKIIMQEVLIVDPDGTRRIERKPKLMTPKLMLDVLNLHDEQAERAFIETIVAQGIPISARTRLRGTKIDLDDELEKVKGEQVRRAVVAEETRRDLFLELQEKRLPIEEDLEQDFQAKTNEAQMAEDNPAMMIDPMTGMPMAPPGSADQGTPLPSPAVPTGDTTALTPLTPEENEENPPAPTGAPGQAPVATSGPGVVVPMQRQRPPESDEQRKRMPKASSNGHVNGNGKLHWQFTGNIEKYLGDWPDVTGDVVLPLRLGAEVPEQSLADHLNGAHDHHAAQEYRRHSSDSIAPYLGTVHRRTAAFYAGHPSNRVEVLDPNKPEHLAKLKNYYGLARNSQREREAEIAARRRNWAPGSSGDFEEEAKRKKAEDREIEGHRYMVGCLDTSYDHGKFQRIVVATHEDHPVAALSFSHGAKIHVDLLGSAQSTYGAATAVQHGLASCAAEHGVGVDSEAETDAIGYHRSIGRIMGRHDLGDLPSSKWTEDDVREVAGAHPKSRRLRLAAILAP